MDPIKILQDWIAEEKQFGAPNPQHAVLSTVTRQNEPRARIVAIREINDQGLLFFTQAGTNKVLELKMSLKASLTFWFELLQRQVQIEAEVEELSESENAYYWERYPFEAQIRFCSYAPTSGQPIGDKQFLENKKKSIQKEYQDKIVPMSPFYKGFRIKPKKIIFYRYRIDELSDVFLFCLKKSRWIHSILSP